jgi:hypothetical protein
VLGRLGAVDEHRRASRARRDRPGSRRRGASHTPPRPRWSSRARDTGRGNDGLAVSCATSRRA